MDSYFDNAADMVGHYLHTGPFNGLEDLCKKLVAQIDSQAIESQRKITQEILDEIRKLSAPTAK